MLTFLDSMLQAKSLADAFYFCLFIILVRTTIRRSSIVAIINSSFISNILYVVYLLVIPQ